MAKLNSKAKGNRGELECVKILTERFGKGFARVPSSGAWAGGTNRLSRADMSLEQRITLVSDIMSPPNFNFTIEHKFYSNANFFDLFNESSDLKKWFNQCSEDAKFVGKEPMLVVKYNGKKRIVFVKEALEEYVFQTNGWYCLWFEDLLKLPDTFFLES